MQAFLEHLLSAASALSAAATPRDVAAVAFRALGALGACAAEIYGLEGTDRLVLLARHGRFPAIVGKAVAVDAPTPASDVIRSGRAVWLESPQDIAQRYPHLEEVRGRHEEGAWAVVPLLAAGKPLGVLAAAFPEARKLDPDERTFVRLVAQSCAQTLERARLFEQAVQSRAEAEWTLALLSGMWGAAPVGLALLDRDMRFLRVNHNFARVDGLSPEAHVGKTPLEILPFAPGEEIAAAFRTVVDTGQPLERDIAALAPMPDAAGTRISTSWFPVRVAGAIAGVGVLVRSS